MPQATSKAGNTNIRKRSSATIGRPRRLQSTTKRVLLTYQNTQACARTITDETRHATPSKCRSLLLFPVLKFFQIDAGCQVVIGTHAGRSRSRRPSRQDHKPGPPPTRILLPGGRPSSIVTVTRPRNTRRSLRENTRSHENFNRAPGRNPTRRKKLEADRHVSKHSQPFVYVPKTTTSTNNECRIPK